MTPASVTPYYPLPAATKPNTLPEPSAFCISNTAPPSSFLTSPWFTTVLGHVARAAASSCLPFEITTRVASIIAPTFAEIIFQN